MPEWISVDKLLPPSFAAVIIYRKVNGEDKVAQGYLDSNGWWRIYGGRVKDVTHWMPLPEPPEDEEGGMSIDQKGTVAAVLSEQGNRA